MNRRALLGSFGAVGAASLAGCLDGAVFEPTTTLGRLSVSNHDETAAHTFDLRVEHDDTTVHESSHRVEQATEARISGAVADCTWEAVAGTYAFHARVDGGEWNRVDRREQTLDLREETEKSSGCVAVELHYDPGETVSDPWLVLVHGCDRYDDRCRWVGERPGE
jgi:hypothetical protein